MKNPRKDKYNLETNRENKLARRVENLKKLVQEKDFSNKQSVAYNAAMYNLIRILETRITHHRTIYPDLNVLRNGLVHGYFDVEPQEVIDFVTAEIDNIQQKQPTSDLNNYAIFQRSRKYSANALRTRIADYRSYFRGLPHHEISRRVEYNTISRI